MKLITKEHGTETNRIECDQEEFKILYEFLAKAGVRLRMTKCEFNGGGAGVHIVTAQLINAYQFFGSLHSGFEKWQRTEEEVKKAIADKCWQM